MSWMLFFAVGIAAGFVYAFETRHQNGPLNICIVIYLGLSAWLFSVFSIAGSGFGLLLIVITLILVGVFITMNFDTLRHIQKHYEAKLDFHVLEEAKRGARRLMEEAETRLISGRAKQMHEEVDEVLGAEKLIRTEERKRDVAQAQRDAEYVDIGREATVQMRQHVIDLVKARKEEKMIGYLTRIAAPPPDDEETIQQTPKANSDSLDDLHRWYQRGRERAVFLLATAPNSEELRQLEQALEPVRRTLEEAGKIRPPT